ncbi:MAG: PASTA domain-containing protein, partial [Oscillospiraceae bacterium]|nr:PASTA domain-containing protein [Oscillospiraceae bacterium]
VIGFTNEEGGAYGLEAVYDDELSGESGMVIMAKDVNGTPMLYQYEQYFDAKDGCSLNTTLDTTVQYYLEKGLAELEARYGTGKGATGIVMDVKTAAILAMASLPNYDPNSPATLYTDFLTQGMSEEEIGEKISDLRYRQWRNKAINDTYEPGSTFKILTLSMALEEGVVNLNSGFDCSGNTVVEKETIWCSNRNGHGHQTLKQATGNSCNPAFINIGLRVGNEKFYNYMKAFGLTEKTGIDTTGEASGFVNSEIERSTLALACYAFGQNFNVTPVALIAAQAACVNGGYLRTPYLVDQIVDSDGNVTYRHDTTPVRQVISEETSANVRDILEYVVAEGTGKNGKVAGYRIGGKTGTADKVGGNVIVSFVCFAPADDPQVIMLLTLDEPSRDTGTYVSGGNMVAPVASSVMAELLPYLGIEPTYSAEEMVGADATVPNLVGEKADEAEKRLKELGFGCTRVGDGETVTDQTPLGGAIVPNNASIILYCGEPKSDALCIVPNVIGDSASVANQKLTNAGLIMSISGATNRSSASVRAIAQSEEPGKEVSAGTVVRVQLSDSSVTD